MQAAQARPDGSFEYGDEIYRIEDRERDHFAVRRMRDAKIMGELRFDGHRYEARAEGDLREALQVIEAIGRLLQGERGLLPLQ